MRDDKRIDDVLSVLRSAWKKNPDLRLCQLIENAVGKDAYYLEDEQLKAALLAKYKG